MNFNCILCKYCNNEIGCNKVISENNLWHCPSLSNIYYGRLIKYFPFKIIDKVNTYIECKRYEKYYIDEYETKDTKFIWGIKSWDCLSPAVDANLYTMNDLDLIYLKNEAKYTLGVETIYFFKDGYNGEKQYIKSLLGKFTDWMISQGYNIDQPMTLSEIFTDGYNINTHFSNIEDAYNTFKIMVEGF